MKSEAEETNSEKGEKDHLVKKLSQEEIVGQCFIFVVAGIGAVSNTLGALLYHLAINPEKQEKLQRDLVSCHPDEEVGFDDLKKSKYLENCINEAMRMNTTVNRVLRKAANDYDFGNFKISSGQTVGVSIYNLHMDEKLFKDPHKFRPERFDGNPDDIPFQPIPFNDGPR